MHLFHKEFPAKMFLNSSAAFPAIIAEMPDLSMKAGSLPSAASSKTRKTIIFSSAATPLPIEYNKQIKQEINPFRNTGIQSQLLETVHAAQTQAPKKRKDNRLVDHQQEMNLHKGNQRAEMC